MQVSNSMQTIELMSIERGCCTLHKRSAGASAADFRFLPEASLENSQNLSKTCFFLFPRGVLLPVLRLRRRTVPNDFAFHVWKRRSGALPDTAWLLTISHCVSIWIPRLCLHVVQPALHLSYLSSFWCGSGSNLSRQSPACCLRWSQQPLVASPSTPAAARASLLSASALVR